MSRSAVYPPDPSRFFRKARVRPSTWRRVQKRQCCNFCKHYKSEGLQGSCPKVHASVWPRQVCDWFDSKEPK